MSVVIAFVLAHQAVLAALGVAVLDLIFALAPSVKSNGILQWILLSLQGKASLPPSVPPAA